MSALSREELFEACRTIYTKAGDDFMLPPLIRDVQSPEARSKHTYYSLTETECIRFIVEFDEAYVDDNKFPLKKFPLRFKCELCDLDFQKAPRELGEIESGALIRAFFLGAKLQIIAIENPFNEKYNFRIQLSSTLFVECGELLDEGDDLTPENVCHQVSFGLYDKSCDFFGSPQDGMTVWRVRVAQELFGEPKPAPEIFWPQEVKVVACRSMDNPVPAAAPVLANSLVTTVAPALATGSLCAGAPILPVSPAHLVKPARAFFRSGIAALLAIGLTGLTLCNAFRGELTASSGKPTISTQAASVSFLPEKAPSASVPIDYAVNPDAPPPVAPASSETPPPITSVRSGDAHEVAEQPSGAAPPLDEAPQMVAEATPEFPLEFAVAPIIPAPKSAVAKSRKQGENLGRKCCAAAKIVSSRTGHGKPSVHSAKRSQTNPLVAMRRAVKSLAAGIAKNLQRIPYQLSSLIAGR